MRLEEGDRWYRIILCLIGVDSYTALSAALPLLAATVFVPTMLSIQLVAWCYQIPAAMRDAIAHCLGLQSPMAPLPTRRRASVATA